MEDLIQICAVIFYISCVLLNLKLISTLKHVRIPDGAKNIVSMPQTSAEIPGTLDFVEIEMPKLHNDVKAVNLKSEEVQTTRKKKIK